MTLFRWTPRALTVAGTVAALTAVPVATPRAHAAPIDRELFTWSGRVDREVYITMRGRDVRTSGVDAGLPNRARVRDGMPRARGDVLVRLQDGRGEVSVVEQPSARNGYTTTIRIRDPRGGADNYRLIAYWAGDDRGWDRDGDWDRRDRDRDRDRDRRDDRWDDCDDRRGNNGRGGGWGRGGRDDCYDRDDRSDRGQDGVGMLRWSGRVDDVVELRIRGRSVEAITRSGQRVSDVNLNVRGGGLPARDVQIRLDRHAGRGTIEVTQQPSAWNNYTAVVRIFDPSGGASFYDFSAYW